MSIQRWEQPQLGPTGRDIIDGWTLQVAAVGKLAEYIAATDFVPKAYRGQPAAVAAAILAGRELGIGPMTSLQHLYVVNGRPAMSAQLMRALVFAAGHTLTVVESTGTRCTMTGARRDGTRDEVTWSQDMARNAGLAGKDVWKSYPRAMLLSRATGELCRRLFPDVIGGMAYTAEEAADIDTEREQPAPATTRRVRRSIQAPPQADVQTEAPPPPEGEQPSVSDPAGDGDTPNVVADISGADEAGGGPPSPPPAAGDIEAFLDPGTYDVPADDPEPLLSAKQRGAIMALMGEWGRLNPRSLRLRTLSGLARREVSSASALNRVEASAIIDTLTELKTLPNPDEALSILVTTGWDHINEPTLGIPDA